MKRALLISVAAIALAAGGQAAFSQGGGGKSGGGGATGGATINANPPGGGASGAATGGGSAGTTGMTGGASTSGAAANDTPNAEHPTGPVPAKKTGQVEKGDKGKQPMKQGEAEKGKQPMQQGQAEHEKGSRQGANERHEGGKQGANERNEGATRQGASESKTKQGTNERAMTSKNVSLTTEQKTTIRTKVLTSSAPRVNNVTFDIRVGTVVPRTVHFATLPPILVQIEPEWRGYRYFVYHDEIIVVNPRTLAIVAVLEV
jgi:hypothetical protein